MLATKLDQINTVMQIDGNLNLTLPNIALKQKEQSEKINDMKAQKILGLKQKTALNQKDVNPLIIPEYKPKVKLSQSS